MDYRKFAQQNLSEGKSAREVTAMLVEEGLSYSEADRIVREASKESIPRNSSKDGCMKTKKYHTIKIAFAAIILIIFFSYSIYLSYGKFSSTESTILTSTTLEYFSFPEKPENMSGNFFTVAYKERATENGVVTIKFGLVRDEIPTGSFDYLYVDTNLKTSEMAGLTGATFVGGGANTYVLDAKDSYDVYFELSGYEETESNITLEGKPLNFGGYNIIISEKQSTGTYQIFGETNI